MDLKQIPAGKDIPNDLNVVIEIPQGSSIKYELDKASGAVMVDRFLFTAMHYPMNYGFIPNTLAEDGDPTDCLVWSPQPVQAGAVLRARPIGVLLMEDENGIDAKIVAVPHGKLAAGYEQIKDVADLPESLRNQIRHFFEHYKDLEPGKWVKVTGWEGAEQASAIVKADVQRHG